YVAWELPVGGWALGKPLVSPLDSVCTCTTHPADLRRSILHRTFRKRPAGNYPREVEQLWNLSRTFGFFGNGFGCCSWAHSWQVEPPFRFSCVCWSSTSTQARSMRVAPLIRSSVNSGRCA